MNRNPLVVLLQGFKEKLNNLWLYPAESVQLKQIYEAWILYRVLYAVNEEERI